MFKIVYPVERRVSADFIRIKYYDAVANCEAITGLTVLTDIMAELENVGLVTFEWESKNDT
jgi:hypothetical protein